MKPSSILPALGLLAMAVSSASAATTLNAVFASTVQDTTSSGGDNRNNSTDGYIFNDTFGGLQFSVGDSQTSVNGNVQLRVGITEFNINANRADIASATQIFLSVTVAGITNAPAGWSVAAYGFTGNSNPNENGAVGVAPNVSTFSALDDGRTAATQSGATYNVASLMVGQTITFDVTALVKADGLDLTNNYSGFRIAPSDLFLGSDNVPGSTAAINNNGLANAISFNTVQLVMIPEPSAFALGVLGSLVLLRRRRV